MPGACISHRAGDSWFARAVDPDQQSGIITALAFFRLCASDDTHVRVQADSWEKGWIGPTFKTSLAHNVRAIEDYERISTGIKHIFSKETTGIHLSTDVAFTNYANGCIRMVIVLPLCNENK